MAISATDLISPLFVGRSGELDAARALLQRAAGGEASLLLVSGEAGVGKTRFVDEVASFAAGQEMRVLSGRCVQLGIEGLPFAPITEALRTLIREVGDSQLDDVLGPARGLVARLVPDVDVAEREPLSNAQVLELVLGLVERLSAREPLVILLEDLHWADRSTLDLAAFLVQNLRRVPAALVVTYRSDEVDRRHPLRPLLATWDRSRSITHVELERFDREATRAQLAAILGAAPDPSTLDLVFERSGGNAFLAEEMLALVRAGDPHGLPPSLRDVLLARVDRLGPAATRVLRTAAVAGRSVPEPLLLAVCGLSEDEALTGIREAVDAQLLVIDAADGYAFRHALASDAVYDDLLPGERMRLHAAFADALDGDRSLLRETDVSVSAWLAHHSYAALDLPRALGASITAGAEALEGLAPQEAVTHYLRALQIWPRVQVADRPPQLDLPDVLYLAGRAAYSCGDMSRATALLTEALAELDADAPAERRARLISARALVDRDTGNVSTAVEGLEEAVALLPESPLTEARAELLASLAAAYLRRGLLTQAEDTAREAVDAAHELGLPALEADALISLGYAPIHQGRLEEGEQTMRRGLDLATECGAAVTAIRGYINFSDVLETHGRSREAISVALPGIALAQRTGLYRGPGTYLASNLAESSLHAGDWAAARRLVTTALDTLPQGVFEESAQLVNAELAVLAGDIEQARAALGRVKALLVDPDDYQFAQPQATLEIEVARLSGAYAGNVDLALAVTRDGDHQFSLRYVWPLVWSAIRSEVERVAARIEPLEVDGRLLELVGTLTAPTVPTSGYRSLVAAALAGTGGDAAAVGAWQEACSVWRATQWPWPLSYSLIHLAETLASAGRRSEASDALAEGWRIATHLGAAPLVADAERLAQAARLGLGEPTRSDDAPDPFARYGLTPREREVLTLVAAGRSNPEIARELFISPKTASVHVSNLLAKLGLSSRVQAASLLGRLDPGALDV
jgi:ATP/maltotriose-dependent transcriptional regulator MalT